MQDRWQTCAAVAQDVGNLYGLSYLQFRWGVLALMKSAHPSWTPAQLIDALRAQADDHACAPAENNGGPACTGPVTDNSYYGEGIVDALDAVS